MNDRLRLVYLLILMTSRTLSTPPRCVREISATISKRIFSLLQVHMKLKDKLIPGRSMTSEPPDDGRIIEFIITKSHDGYNL